MYQITPLISELKKALIDTINHYPENSDNILQLLDGRPSSELRRLVPLKDLRESGAFFTGSRLRNIAISDEFVSSINKSSVLADPACGGGDLLLACAPYLPISTDLFSTLKFWQSKLIGIDLHPEFIEIAKLRLILKAITLHRNPGIFSSEVTSGVFPKFRTGSIFNNLDALNNATHVILNPPFYMMPCSDSCDWASGKVNAAAVFLEACIKNVQAGTRIVAILPDVLRSGTRYEKWRKNIESNCEIKKIHLYGQFDIWTDVDVFVIELIVKKKVKTKSNVWVNLSTNCQSTISDKFDISIGPVVDYRDPFDGPIVKYIYPRLLPAWERVVVIKNTRPYKGRTFESPFVVVRRTSRQTDRYRAIGTIIDIDNEVAVENHLIVLMPKDGNLSTCQDLLKKLKDERTNAWLNKMIRCRHLTIRSLSDLPWWSE